MAKPANRPNVPATAVDAVIEQARQHHSEVSYADLLAAVEQSGETVYITDLETTRLVSKADLVNVPMIVKRWTIKDGDMGSYAVVEAVTIGDVQVVFADGSTGVYAQLVRLSDKGISGPIVCPKGLTASTYTVNVDGHDQPATTYYLATS